MRFQSTENAVQQKRYAFVSIKTHRAWVKRAARASDLSGSRALKLLRT